MAERELRLRERALHWREVEGEVIALEGDTSTYLAANPSGTILWEALAKGATRGELIAALVGQFAISEAVAGRDVDAFLRQLEEQNLLEDVQ